ncbi:MAG TPA: EAL domain-containing protein [Xanthomonadaceae bacterium]|nr:EAL domain-containing protein [Xanthomonadaceae bacterium]
MHARDETQQQTELRLAFMRHLPQRVEGLRRRGRRFCEDGWDINGLSLLHSDVQRLAGTSGRYGLLETSERMLSLETLLGNFLSRESVPDAAADERILTLLGDLAPDVRDAAAAGAPAVPAYEPGPAPDPAEPRQRFEPAPPNYWRRWVGDAPSLAPGPADDAAPGATASLQAPPAPRETPAPRLPEATLAPKAAPAHGRIYHLTDGEGLSVELDQRLEAMGYEIELLESADELKEVLSALVPDLVIVSAGFQFEVEGIGAVLRLTRKRSGASLRLLVMAQEDSVPVRLAARRAGADALLIAPQDAEAVVARIGELLDPERESPYRILVVEDDRSQGLFAESILRNAGMEPLVVDDAFKVLDAMERFVPDLVLMDLYMPQCDGTELTALIREREEFLNTPIVFLSGESDQDKHFAALDAGGDDFLSKPIRPKYLIAAVNNRVRRARALQRRAERRDPRDPATGLYERIHLLDLINEALSNEQVRNAPGGVLFVEIDGTEQLRERYGLSAFEALIAQVARLVAESMPRSGVAARFGDGSFCCVIPEDGPEGLEALGRRIHGAVAGHPFESGGQSLRMRPQIGIAEFRYGFADANAALNAAERATRQARQSERGIHRFEPARRADQEHEAAMVQLLREAIDQDGFELLYQPIVAVQGGERAQYQALVRLRDDSGRLHTAAEFIALAERADLVPELDRWVLTRAMRLLEHRRDEQRPVRLFVTQSPQSLASEEHGVWLRTQFEARKLPWGTLVLELDATAIRPRLAAIAACCGALVPYGLQFCLSQFVADQDSALVLDAVPADLLKLSPRYLAAAGDAALRDELRGVIEDAHRRGMEVIAPRVEDARAASTLWMSGIDFLQGNLVQQAGRTLDFDFTSAVL